MSELARRITKTTTTTSSAASTRFIGGEEVDGVVRVDDGGGMIFRGGGVEIPHRIRSRMFESTGDDGDTEDLMEPDLSDTSHMKFVDGRCSCCPYGYHVDLDFLQYLDSLNSGEYLNSLKKRNLSKEQLRKSMESYLEQQELARRSGTLMSSAEKENQAATRVLNEIDKTIEGHLATYDRSAPTKVLADGTNQPSDYTYDKKYTETIELRKIRHQHNAEFDSGSSLSISSGPSSPTLPYSSSHGLGSQAPSGSRTITETTVSNSTSVLPKHKRLLELEQQLLEIKPIPPTDHFQRTYINSAEFASQMAELLPEPEQDRSTPTPTNEGVNGAFRQQGEAPSSEMTRISAATLQAIREQMAASLQRMHELEEQVKAIPVLQVRNSVLKEEKRKLEMQLQSKADRLRSIGVGDFSVDESDFDERSEYSYKRYTQSVGDEEQRRMMALRGEGDGPDGVYRSSTTVSLGYGLDGELIPVRVHEKELKTEENTEIREKEVKTIFLGGTDDVLTTDLTGDRPGRMPSLTGKPARKDVRSIGVGEGNVFDAAGGMEIHQKELRTVYIGDAGKEVRSTRNVGILCKPAMRDVGMVHMIDSERPMTRTIAVGVGEVGVGDAGFYSGDEGTEGGSTTQTMNAAMSQMTISAYQSRFLGLKNDQLRLLLDEMLKRTVHSVAVQCSFSTEDKAIDAARVGYEMVDVACSDDKIDVEVVPIRQMKSVAIDNRPSLFHRASGTDVVYKIDMATNTQTLGIRHHRATSTEPAVTFPAATNTEAPATASTAAGTEKSVFYALEQLINTGTNTNIQEFWNAGMNTDLTGDVQELVIKPVQKDISVNTTTSSVRVLDKTTSTIPSQLVEKSVNTTAVPRFERGINTERVRTSAASVNTDRSAFVSRGTDCNIIQPEKKAAESSVEEGNMQTSRLSEVTRTIRTTATDSTEPVERREFRSSITRQQEPLSSSGQYTRTYTSRSGTEGPELQTGQRDVQSSESKTDNRSEFEEEVTMGGSGGRTTTTRIVKTVTQGGRSEIKDDFPVTETSVYGSGRDQVAGAETSRYQRNIAFTDRPEFEEEFSLGGSEGTVTRTVTTVARGGRSGFVEDFPSSEVGFRSLANREVGLIKTERPEFDEGFRTGSSGGRTMTTRTVRTVKRGGGQSEVIEDFPLSEVTFQDSSKEGHGGAESEGSQRMVTTRTVKRTYHGGGGEQSDSFSSHGLLADSDATRRTIISGDESHLLGRMDEDFSRLHKLRDVDLSDSSASGQSGYSSTRTITKRTSGDPDDPESWFEETWVSEGSGDGTSGRQVMETSGRQVMETSGRQVMETSESQRQDVEVPEEETSTTEVRVERHASGKTSSSRTTSSEEPLRSIMKTSQRSDQSLSGRRGITFSESAANQFEVSKELESACKVYDQWLEDSTRVTAKELNSSIAVIQNEWFKASSQKSATLSRVEGFLNMTHSLSPDLMKQVINMAHADAGQTALMLAVGHGRLDMVNMLLDAGANVNLQDENGSTALMYAAEHGLVDITRLLLSQRECDALIADKDGSTALSIAKEEGHQSIVSLLNAHVNVKPKAETRTGSIHKARKTVTRFALSSATDMS